jgi:eukaryotic-like serine/threonine-protein kinase
VFGQDKDTKVSDSPAIPGETVLIDDIEILELLGQGARSAVFKARQKTIDRIVAVKVLSSEAMTGNVLPRFQQEARLTGKLSHPNIVKTLAFGISRNNLAYIIQEYVEGRTLAEELKVCGRMRLSQFRDVFIPVLSGLAAAHESGLVHRDIKPANIMLDSTGEGSSTVKLLDFGITRELCLDEGEVEGQDVRLTRSGVLTGSPAYMSPEQCNGKEVDAKSDIYSISCVMYEALTGAPPFAAETPLEVMHKQIHEPPPTVSELTDRLEISKKLAALVLVGLAKEPSARPRSAAELADKLSRVMGEMTLEKVPQASVGKEDKKRRNDLIFAVVSFLAVVLALVSMPAALKSIQKGGLSSPKVSGEISAIKKPAATASLAGSQNPEVLCCYYLQKAKEEMLKGYADKEGRAQHGRAAADAYREAAKYTLVNGKETLATLKCYAAVAFAEIEVRSLRKEDAAALELAWKYANMARVGFEKSESMEVLPANYVLPDGALMPSVMSKAQAYCVLCSVYSFNPFGHGSLDDAVACGKKSIDLLLSDPVCARTAVINANSLAQLLSKYGRTKEAVSILDRVARSARQAEEVTGSLNAMDVDAWTGIANTYNLLGEKQKEAEAAKHIAELKKQLSYGSPAGRQQ